MQKKRSNQQQHKRAGVLLLGDVLTLWLAWELASTVAAWLGRGGVEVNGWSIQAVPGGGVYLLAATLVLLALLMRGQYWRRLAFWEETRVLWRYVALAALLNFALNFFVQVSYTRTIPLLAWMGTIVLLPLGRLVARELLIGLDIWQRRVLLVGQAANTAEARQALRQERHLGMKVAGVMPFEGDTQAVEARARELNCGIIIAVLDETLGERGHAAQLVRRLHMQKFEVYLAPHLHGLPLHGLHAQYMFSNDLLLLHLQHRLISPVSRLIKRTMDVLAALLLLVLLMPLMLWVAWRIWREDGGPVLYCQPRVGCGQKDFAFYKFRSMVQDADARLAAWEVEDPVRYAEYQTNFKLRNDPRVLRVGGLIRRTSIDELPQLWNVLRGDMSMVGPRPLLRRELPKYQCDVLDLYEQVRPGITGLWQVSGRSRASFSDRAKLDAWYVRNWSLWVDWVILFKTVRVVLSGRGAM